MLAPVKERPGNLAASRTAACRPSLTAARHDSLGNVQAGTKRCSRPNQKIAQKRRTECRQIRYPDPKTSPLHEIGAKPNSLHAPEVECIGKGKAYARQFGMTGGGKQSLEQPAGNGVIII